MLHSQRNIAYNCEDLKEMRVLSEANNKNFNLGI